MQQATEEAGLPDTALEPVKRPSIIYIAGPCTPMGGGMFRIAEYLMQSQEQKAYARTLRLLDTRGPGSVLLSPYYLLRAVATLVRTRVEGRLAGVHINCAERLSLVRKCFIAGTCKLMGVPTVLHLHAAELHSTYAALSRPARALVRAFFSLPSCCIVLGQRSADFLIEEISVSSERVQIVMNGVPEPLVPRDSGRPRDTFRLLFVGNLSERKGVADLLHALASPVLANCRLQLTLAGGGDVAGYRSLAERLGVGDRVLFLGWAEKADVDQYLASADALILPSYAEGLPLCILEALAQGVPVICSPVGEIPQFLQDDQTALFVPPGDIAGIASAVAKLASDADRRERIGSAGRSLYEKRFSLPRFANAVFDIYDLWFKWAPASTTVTATKALTSMRKHQEEA